jgi:GR25 family glycosyltransferase involved in LPS biosynthesis
MINNPFDYFDGIYCINLDERRDRWANAVSEFSKIGILDRVKRFPAIKHSDGSLGCTLGIVSILKIAKENNFKNVLIFEDDVKFIVDDPQKVLQQTIDQIGQLKWHLFYLGANTHKKLVKFKPNLILLKNAFALHSVAYSDLMYDVLIKKYDGMQRINQFGDILDVYLAQQIQENYICLMPHPMMTTQINSYSDIEKRFVNYEFIEERYKNNIK